MRIHALSLMSVLCLALGSVACGSDSTNNANNGNNTTCTPATTAYVATLSSTDGYTGPASPTLCPNTMFSKYGSAFGAVNTAIINLALNPNTQGLGTSFQTKLADANTTRQGEFTTNLANFLVAAYGGAAYTGPGIVQAHGDLAITGAQYTAFITNVVVPALQSVVTVANGADPNDIGNCFAPVVLDPNFVVQVVTCQ